MSMGEAKKTGQGMNALRDRYVTRADTVLRTPEFYDLIHAARSQWRRNHPPFAFEEERSDQLPVVMDPDRVPVLLPGKLASASAASYARHAAGQITDDAGATIDDDVAVHIASLDFRTLALDLCSEIWPEEWFRYRPTQPHVGVAVASACLIHPPSQVVRGIHQLIPRFPLGVQRLPHQPMTADKSDIVKLEGERDYLLECLAQAIDADVDERDRLRSQAKTAGLRRFQEKYPSGDVWPQDSRDEFVFVQLESGLIQTDFVNALPSILRAVRETFGSRPFAEDVRALKAQGFTVDQIMYQLGAKSSTVKDALKETRPIDSPIN